MSVKQGNKRHMFKLSGEYNEKLQELADKEKRSISKQVEYIVTQYLDDVTKGREDK